ncbi:MAG: hypothetical protein IMW99_11265, partial [Firmicutes bacterium]|nr:hypothetical protein [Bacillota bacterium]
MRCLPRCRLLLSVALGLGLAVAPGVAPLAGLAVPGGGRAMAAGGGAEIPAPAAPAQAGASGPVVEGIAGMVNLHHLDSLVGEVR